MRVLAVSPTPTHPQDAGNRARIHALLRGLKAAGHAVHLCLLLRENPSPAALAAMRAEWDEVTEVPHDRGRERRSLGELHAVDDWITEEAEAAFAALAARRPGFDLVLVEYVFLSRALEHFGPGVRKVIDTHDVFGWRTASSRRRRRRRRAGWTARIWCWRSRRRRRRCCAGAPGRGW